MSPWRRVSVALALGLAGGFGLPGIGPGTPRPAGGLTLLAVALLTIAVGLLARIPTAAALRPAEKPGSESPPAPPEHPSSDPLPIAPLSEPASLHAGISMGEQLALLGIAVVLARALAQQVAAAPAIVWGLAALGVSSLVWATRDRGSGRAPSKLRTAGRILACMLLVLTASAAGDRFEARGSDARGVAHSGPILGVHAGQSVALRIDGYGPHDLYIDADVDPAPAPDYLGPRPPSHDPEAWARRLQAGLRKIAASRYAEGPAAARSAYAGATVRLIDGRIEVHSGTVGPRSSVEFVCPGQVGDPRPFVRRATPPASCPSKYAIDGSTGLGVSRRWPGYSERPGRDRLRLAHALGWPSGDAQGDRRLLALEFGLLSVLTLGLAVLAAVWAKAGARRSPATHKGGPGRQFALCAGLGLGLVVLLALAAGAQPQLPVVDAPRADAGIPISPTWLTVLALLLAAVPGSRRVDVGAPPGSPVSLALPVALPVVVLLLLAASPLAGLGGALEWIEAGAGALADVGRLPWGIARALVGGIAGLVTLAGLGASMAAALGARDLEMPAEIRLRTPVPRQTSEGRHTRPLPATLAGLGAAGLALLLALRKPGVDPSLLCGAATWLIAAQLPSRPWNTYRASIGGQILTGARRCAPVVLACVAAAPLCWAQRGSCWTHWTWGPPAPLWAPVDMLGIAILAALTLATGLRAQR